MQIITNDECLCGTAIVDCVSTKMIQNKRSYVFSSVNNVRLTCLKEITSWLKNDWHTLIKSFTINNHSGIIDATVTNANDTPEADNANSDYDETIDLFLKPNENLTEIS